jgi:hypothetical protein
VIAETPHDTPFVERAMWKLGFYCEGPCTLASYRGTFMAIDREETLSETGTETVAQIRQTHCGLQTRTPPGKEGAT